MEDYLFKRITCQGCLFGPRHELKFTFFLLLGIQFLLVVGGYSHAGGSSSDVQVYSLDPETNPVPNCLAEMNSFPVSVHRAAAGMLGSGKLMIK
jgi:hypothetical protein